MSSLPGLDDLALVEAVRRHGSVGAAARELLVSQPAASNRLAALERRIGERLFDRDTTGARPTAAGQALADEAAHILGHLETVVERTRAAARAKTLRVGTFGSLAPWLFPALAKLIAQVNLAQVTDHGDRLIEWVGEGSLDAAFVAIANQMRLPAGVAAVPIAGDRLAALVPQGITAGRGRKPFAGQTVIAYTYDMASELLHDRLSALGAQPQLAATAETAVRMARQLGCPAILPRGLASGYAADAEQVVTAPISSKLTIFMVTRRPAPAELAAIASRLHTALGMPGPSRGTEKY